jgi:hypothetical protein
LLGLNIPVQFIHGNGEAAVLAEMTGSESNVPEQFREAVRWNPQQLDSERQRLLAGWPKTLHVDIPRLGEVLFCHATTE